MAQTTQIHDTLPPAADVQTCSEPGCGARAEFAYRWEWGATGLCCAHHATLLQQTAGTLNRTIAVYPIQQAAPEALTRDERTKLKAAALVLEEELAEAQSKGLALYRRNGDMQVQLNTAVVRERELKAQLSDAVASQAEAERRLAEVDKRNGELLVEVDRLRELEAFVAERDARETHERGLEGDRPNVVE